MTENEIKTLVREYAEASCPVGDYCGGVYDDARNDDIARCINEATPFLKWLSEHHCIVKKIKIIEWSNKSEFIAFDTIDLIEILDDLFGKEIFNEKRNESTEV